MYNECIDEPTQMRRAHQDIQCTSNQYKVLNPDQTIPGLPDRILGWACILCVWFDHGLVHTLQKKETLRIFFCLPRPQTYVKAGHHRADSETPFEWRLAGG